MSLTVFDSTFDSVKAGYNEDQLQRRTKLELRSVCLTEEQEDTKESRTEEPTVLIIPTNVLLVYITFAPRTTPATDTTILRSRTSDTDLHI